MLIEKYIESLQNTKDIAINSYLTFLQDAVKKVEGAANNEPTLTNYVNKLVAILAEPNFALDGNLTNEFAQTLGEAHFFVLCLEKGIALNRITEQDRKTPDFRLNKNTLSIFFEVKTLSVVEGQNGIHRDLEGSFKAQIEIGKQLRAGKRVAFAESVVQPYGGKPYEKGKREVTAVIETLIEKTRNNIKRDQFANANSILVLNLSIIHPFRTDSFVLRPAYFDPRSDQVVTGDLWMLAFGKPGMLIHGIPEFEGKPGIEGILGKCGILSDPEFDNIAGILIMVHPWQRPAEIWGLLSSQRCNYWEANNPDIMTIILTLTGGNWNDDEDSNGWSIQGAERTIE